MDTKKLRQKILDLAIRGKLVPQDPNDEPASVLIEKIRAEKEQLIKEKKIKRDKNESHIYRSDKSYYEKFADGTVKCIDEEIPFEIPESWEWCRGYSCFLPMVSTKPTNEFFRYIDIESVDNKKHSITSPKVINSNEAPSRASRKLSSGDTLFSMVRPYLENIAFIDNPYADCIASTGFYVCKPNEFLFPKYSYRLMTSLYVIEGLNQYMKGDNSPSINNDNILSWLYPIPPFVEQQKIVSTIEQYNDLVDDLEQNKDDLQQFITQTKSKILDLAIRGKLVSQDSNDEPASILLERIKAEHPRSEKKTKNTGDNSHYTFDIPETWEWATLENVIDVISGVSYQKNDICENGIRILRGGNIDNNKIHLYADDVFIPESYYNQENCVKKGDIVIVASTGSSQLIGKPGFAKDSFADAQIGAFLRIIRPKVNDITPFLWIIFETDYYKDYIRNLAKGTSINNIRNDYITSFNFPLPPILEQKRIVQKIEEIFSSLDEISNSIIA